MTWHFSGAISCERQKLLTKTSSFREVIEEIHKFKRIVRWGCFPGDKGPIRECYRAQFVLEISKEAFDQFFNSEFGYRGQFFLSIDQGEKSNAEFLRLLQDDLIAFALSVPSASPVDFIVSENWLSSALTSQHAKAWLLEVGIYHTLDADGLNWAEPRSDTAEIINGRWDLGHNHLALKGRKAPTGKRLHVMSGWLNRAIQDIPNPLKCGRGEQIHRFGWS